MTDRNCPHCGGPLTHDTDGIPCYICDACERLWPASYFDGEDG